TDELKDADDPGPDQPVLEADAFEETPRTFDIAEQDLVAVKGERAAGDQADQRFGDRRKDRVKAPERRDEKFRRVGHGGSSPWAAQRTTSCSIMPNGRAPGRLRPSSRAM